MAILAILVSLLGLVFLKDHAKFYNRKDMFANAIPASICVVLFTLSGVFWTFHFIM